ncbi:proline-rich protein [Mycena maculata]|uniref:Proline-rich protein n=1 Tax=Mycena maculata TaxID=230809 RepID=A0AAD7I3X7_9AGAR|nr:proline-rich protein [Mycena maculata]
MADTQEAPDAPAPTVNGVESAHHQTASEADAQEMVITSLRSQIQDLFSQVTQLNGKLVKSYDRVSDLEDDLHMASAQARQSSLKISQLELERTQHLSALNTGLLVEKSHVTAELTRLMEKATDEAAQRGQAESAKADIEKDLDDLSATLFAQANTMVAEARYSQAMTERRVEQAETALKGAEEMVGMMQQQMQTLQGEKDEAEKKAREMQLVMGKGKWVDRRSGSSGALVKETRLLSSHLPYQEFLLFVAHLRSVHPSSPSPPAMTTLLPMPFLARLSSEDSEPTVRLDLAPSLNWLSRRSVLAAIHTGQLTIEPMSSSALLSESSANSGANSNIPGLNSSNNNISCALCGTPIFSTPELPHHHHSRPPTHPSMHNHSPNNSWSASVLKKTLSYTNVNGSPTPPPRSLSRPMAPALHEHSAPYPPQIYIFRIATPQPPPAAHEPAHPFLEPLPVPALAAAAAPPPHGNALTNLSLNALTQSTVSSPTIYPLCTSGWCLARLRATCTLWAFVRTGVVERVWEEEVPNLPASPPVGELGMGPPPVPPRRRGLWGMASALGERAASWSGDGNKEKKAEEKGLPTPPPMHPTISAPSRPVEPAPPLPKRSEGRNRPAPPPPPRPEQPDLPNPHPELAVSAPAPAVAVKAKDAKLPAESELPNPHPEPVAPAPVLAVKAEDAKLKRFSAHQVPLPHSRPGTPAAAASPIDAPPPAAAPGSTDAVPTAPVAPTPGAAPPPLPRRAAARAVRPVPPPPETASAATENAAAETPAVVNAGEAAGGDEGAKAPVQETVEKVAEADASVPNAEETKPDAEAPPTPETSGDAAAVEEPAAAVEKEEEKAEKATDEEAKVDVDIPRVDSPPLEAAKEEVEKPAANGHLDEDLKEKAQDTKEGEEHEAYVGDVTWEERTWKELVRLREDMFWARIGGLR